MKKEYLDKTDKSGGLLEPKGYFDNLTEKIMQNLPETDFVETKPITLWERVRPWTYMAAMFVGIALMFKVFSLGGEATAKSDVTAMAEENEETLSAEVEDDFFYDNVTDYSIYEFIADSK